MRTHAFRRTVCALLAILMLFSVSCSPSDTGDEGNTTTTTSDQKLEILPNDPPLQIITAEDTEEIERMISLFARAVRQWKGYVLDDGERAELSAYVRDHVIPLLANHSVALGEASSILNAAETLMGVLESAGGTQTYVRAMCDFYRHGLSLLGDSRFASLCYEAVLMRVDYEIDYAKRRYEEYGKQWYLDDFNRFTVHRARLTETVGRDAFGQISDFAYFSASLACDTLPNMLGENGELTVTEINADELLLIIRRQARHFADAEISREVWSIVATLASEWVPETVLSDLGLTSYQKKAIRAAGFPAWFAFFASAAPEALDFYAAFAENLTAERLTAMLGEDENAAMQSVCQTISACRDAFLPFVSALEQYGATATEKEYAVITRAGLESDFSAMLETMQAVSATPQALYDAIGAFAQDPSDGNKQTLQKTVEAYCFGMAPYLTFAYLTEA